MKWKIAAAVAVVLGTGSVMPARAAVPGYYLATFKYPGGTFQHCFQLVKTDSYPGYTSSGTWVDTDFPNTAGSWVVYKRTIHLAGYVSDPNETDYLAIDGQFSGPTLVNATFDYFSPQGVYFAAGSLTEMRDPACKNPG